jgi:endonuclease YncB( thermonuclease family)
MGISERIPGLQSVTTIRNIVIGSVYVVFVVALFPLLFVGGILAIPVVLGVLVGRNHANAANRLSFVPGISEGGGAVVGIVAFLYGIALFAGLSLAVPGGDAPQEAPNTNQMSIGGGLATSTPTTSTIVLTPPSTTAIRTSTASSVDGTTTRETQTTLPSPEPTPTASPTPTATPPKSERTEFTVTIVDVVDGDTMEAEFQDGSRDTLRLLGIDTPELNGGVDPEEFEGIPDSAAGRDWLEGWAENASDYAQDELAGEEVRIVVDETADRRGSYDRLLVYLYIDCELFNERLLEKGHARLYDSEFSKRDEFASDEADAQTKDIGLWAFEESTLAPTSTPAPTPTPEPAGGGVLVVSEIHEDAAGNDHENENDEYIVFRNDGNESLDLTGWSVEDEADHTYYFPDGFTLDAGDEVTLHTGSGADTDTDLYWGSDAAIWNNGGDTIYVYDESGETVIERSYDGD